MLTIPDIFNIDVIYVREQPPLDFTAFIKMEDYLDATKTLIKSSVSKTGDIIYYVDCPNEQNHNSDNPTATMIFAQEGEKNPWFLCHHKTTCSNLNFKDFMEAHSDINPYHFIDESALMEYQQSCQNEITEIYTKNEQDTEEQQELSKEISFYGYDFEGFFYFGSTDSYMLLKYKAGELTEKNLYSILSNQSLWFKAFSDMSKKNPPMYWNNAAEWLIRKSKNIGPFKQRNTKFLGIYEEKDQFVLNTGTYVILENGKRLNYHEVRNLYEKSLYLPYTNEIHIAEREATQFEINRFIETIFEWPIASKFDMIKFLGVLICGLVPGALEQRPCGWITAETGSGKSELFSRIVATIWKAAGAVIGDKNSSASGFQNAAKNCHVSYSYDEAEADNKTGNERVSGVLEILLSVTTNSQGSTYKGNPYGDSLSYKNKSCYLLGSIGDKIDKPALKRRVASISMIHSKTEIFKNHYSPNWSNLKSKTIKNITEEFAECLFLYIFNRLKKLNENIAYIDNYLRNNSKIESNLIGLYSSIFGAYLSLKNEFKVNDSSIEEIQPYIEQLEDESFQSIAEISTGTTMINTLYDIGQTRTADNKNIHIADLISVSLGYNNFDNPIGFTPAIANDLLSKCGIRVLSESKSIVLANKNQWLTNFFDKLGHANYSSRLKTFPGATVTKQPIHFFKSGSHRGIIIPLNEDFFEDREIKHIGKIPDILNIDCIYTIDKESPEIMPDIDF